MSARFKVLQFNMQFGQRWDEARPDQAPIDLPATIAELRRHDADIILLQEVEHAQPGGTQPPLPPNYSRIKQSLPGYDGYFAYPKEDPRELPFGIGLAIFSRTPLYNHRRVDLPSPPVEFDFYGERKTPTDRLLIGARTVIGGREVNVFNTHLLAFFMLRTSSESHPGQRQRVLDEIRAAPGATLIGGDFNVSNHDSLITQFAAGGFATVQSTEITWRRRPLVLDHIFHNETLRRVGHAVVPTPASDHHVVIGEFEFA